MLIREVEVLYKPSPVALKEGETYSGSPQIFNAFGERMWRYPVETFVVLCLNGKNHMLHWEQISRGTLTAALVHPREVFFTAIKVRAAGIICLHNHPSGDPSPSGDDIELTKRLAESGKILGIRLIDHLVIGDQKYFSFTDEGLL